MSDCCLAQNGLLRGYIMAKKLNFNGMMIIYALHLTNTLRWGFIVQTH